MSRLVPIDIEQHPPVEVRCPQCGEAYSILLESLWRRVASGMKAGVSDAAIRRVMVGSATKECERCGSHFRWELKAVRRYAAESVAPLFRPRPENISFDSVEGQP